MPSDARSRDLPASVVLALTQDTVDAQGQPVPATVAAERLASRLDVVRSVPKAGRRDPVGVVATINFEVEGLRGRSLVLYWRLLPAGEGVVVPDQWAQPTPAARLTAGTESDTGVLEIWVPLPAAGGQYTLDLFVLIEPEHAQLASFRTDPFG
ncbi:hypothetical protein ACI8AC_21125 [Geodermatophilus sp. SYSU D00758]